MNDQQIENLIKRLEGEIITTKKTHDVSENLLRLKEVAKLYRGEDHVVSFQTIAEKIRQEKEELKIMSGWIDLDKIIGGFRLQQVVVVAALTKSGKTSFLMDLTDRIKDFSPMWLPFEESAYELVRKFVERNQEPPAAYTPEVMKGNTFDWMESKIIESIAKYNTKVVIIDQLDFIVPLGGDNHSLRVGQAMRDLKSLAKKWNVVIFIISHLVKTRMDTEPTLEDLKGSSSIGQEADTVIMLWREMRRRKGHVEISNNSVISVQANRRTGKTGNVKMVYVDGRFLERDWSTEHEEEAEENW